jgi:hypothetical protein
LPIVRPILALAGRTGTTPIVKPIVDLMAPTLRVLIDLGYDRSINPGVYTPFKLIPIINPVRLAADLDGAAVEGVRDALSDIGGMTTPALLAPTVPSTPSTLAALQPHTSDSATRSAGDTTTLTPTAQVHSESTIVGATTSTGTQQTTSTGNGVKSTLPGHDVSPSRTKLSGIQATRPKWRPGNLLRPHTTSQAASSSEKTTGTTTSTGTTTTETATTRPARRQPPATGPTTNRSRLIPRQTMCRQALPGNPFR